MYKYTYVCIITFRRSLQLTTLMNIVRYLSGIQTGIQLRLLFKTAEIKKVDLYILRRYLGILINYK